jgi:hypothetical protein
VVGGITIGCNSHAGWTEVPAPQDVRPASKYSRRAGRAVEPKGVITRERQKGITRTKLHYTNMNSMNSDSPGPAEKLIRIGAELAGSAAAAGAGFLAAGPAGAVAASTLSPLVAHTLREVGAELRSRVLGPREEVRAGAALAYASAKISENLEKGRKIRDDGFFSQADERSAGDEVAEKMLLAAQRDPEEKKVKFYGNLLGNLAFHAEIDRETAGVLLRLAERLSYQQLVLLTVMFNQAQVPLPTGKAADIARTPTQFAIFQELMELYSLGLLGSASAVLDLGWLTPKELKPQSLALQLYMLMELHTVDPADMISVVVNMQGPARTHVG